MNAGKQNKDQRRHARLILQDPVFLTFRPHFDRIGPIVDISKGGVSLKYAVIQEYTELTDTLCVDIFSSSKKFEMFNVPCRLVYDHPISQSRGFLETIETRRCGLEFINLTEQQTMEIEMAMEAIGNSPLDIRCSPLDSFPFSRPAEGVGEKQAARRFP